MSMLKDLPINTNGKLTSDARKNLMLIIEQEFTNKESLYHQIQEREEAKIIEAYRKSVGYEELRKEYDKKEMKVKVLNDEMKTLTDKIRNLGLTIEGEADTENQYRNGTWERNYKGKELQDKLKTIKANAPSQNLKGKLITRLMLATTIGEANVVMREVLGNGIIPDTDIKSISFQG